MNCLAVLALLLPHIGTAPAPDDNAQLIFEILLIQLHPDAERALTFDGDVMVRQVPMLADLPLIGEMFESEARPSYTLILADEAIIRRGDKSWRLMDGPPPADAPFDVMNAPRLIASEHQDARISVGQQVHYLDRGEDGCLTVQRCEECFEGVHIDIASGEASSTSVEIDGLSVEISTIAGREELEGVPLDVGRPRMKRRVVEAAFKIAPDQIMVMQIADPDDEDDREPILLLLTVRVLSLP
jgi:hypothetical protein